VKINGDSAKLLLLLDIVSMNKKVKEIIAEDQIWVKVAVVKNLNLEHPKEKIN
jgi:hypothetical protein